MVKYLLASHGSFSEGTLSFLKIMMGVKDNLYTMTAFLDDVSIQDRVKETLEAIGEFEQLIVFCDIHGGSVEQELFRQSQLDERDIQIIAGYNIPLVMDIIIRDSALTKEEIREIIHLSKEGIFYTNDFCLDEAEDDLF